MKGFPSRYQRTIKLYRPDHDPLVLTLTAPRAGLMSDLQKALEEQSGEDDGGQDLAYLMVGHCLGANLDKPPSGFDDLPAQAEAVRAELAEANLRDAEVGQIIDECQRLVMKLDPIKEVSADAGNSEAPEVDGA